MLSGDMVRILAMARDAIGKPEQWRDGALQAALLGLTPYARHGKDGPTTFELLEEAARIATKFDSEGVFDVRDHEEAVWVCNETITALAKGDA